jgi:hypothetical protein
MLIENAEHRRKYNKMLDDAKEAYTFDKTPSFTQMIRESAHWVDTLVCEAGRLLHVHRAARPHTPIGHQNMPPPGG